MLNQQSQLLLTQLIMQIATFVGIYYYWGTFTILDYFIIFIFIFFFAVVLLETFLHRYCSHNSYQLSKPLKTIIHFFSIFNLQGDSVSWKISHKQHHKYPDQEKVFQGGRHHTVPLGCDHDERIGFIDLFC